jgi:HD superfamily phosphodiesterase
MNKLEQSLLQANERRYSEASNPLKSHGPDHHLRVYRYAQELAKKLKVDYDEEVLAGAALLHDMAAYYPDRTGEDYHEFDHQIAEEVLREINFPAEKVEKVSDVIAHHGSDPQYKQEGEPIETVLLRDADKLDVFGPVGVARIIMVRTLKGNTLPEIVADFYTQGHLQRKWDSITTDEARELARADYEYAVKFFERLQKGLNLQKVDGIEIGGPAVRGERGRDLDKRSTALGGHGDDPAKLAGLDLDEGRGRARNSGFRLAAE